MDVVPRHPRLTVSIQRVGKRLVNVVDTGKRWIIVVLARPSHVQMVGVEQAVSLIIVAAKSQVNAAYKRLMVESRI